MTTASDASAEQIRPESLTQSCLHTRDRPECIAQQETIPSRQALRRDQVVGCQAPIELSQLVDQSQAQDVLVRLRDLGGLLWGIESACARGAERSEEHTSE